jgi:hypothetical protein
MSNGQKIWIGSGAWASIINVFARVFDSQGEFLGITGFTIPENYPGLRQGEEALTMGVRGMVQNTIYLEDVKVSPKNLLGQLGKGFDIAQDTMQLGRLGIASICIGGMKRCAQLILRYSKRRIIAREPLIHRSIILARLGNITQGIGALECFVKTIGSKLDAQESVPPEAYLAAKIIAPELMWQAADYLVQSLGGRGYIETNIAPQIFRDARLLRIFESPTETLQMYLGSMTFYHCHLVCGALNKVSAIKDSSEQLQEIVQDCKQSLKDKQLSQGEEKKLVQILAEKLGDLAAWAFLLATVDEYNLKPSSKPPDSIRTWTQRQLEVKVDNIKKELSSPSVIFDLKVIEKTIESYKDGIGEVEQTLAGEEHQLDDYLLLERDA